MPPMPSMPSMPDVSQETLVDSWGPLERVGMTDIELPIWILEPLSGERFRSSAKVDAFVNLNASRVRGIHMSRLYLALQKRLDSELLTFQQLGELIEEFIQSQKGISDSASVCVKFDWPVQRKALISDKWGWRQYPVALSATKTHDGRDGAGSTGPIQFFAFLEATYSSTCPCSAALARQLIQKQFAKDFANQHTVNMEDVTQWLGEESSMVATPHAQRSHARLKLEVGQEVESPIHFIDLVEESLGTPVQTVVKRQDEQEFARRNGSQLMFCEDAIRKIRKELEKDSRVLDYWIQVEHLESLHPHNATSIATKGLPHGFRV